jgi:hypothetical protein
MSESNVDATAAPQKIRSGVARWKGQNRSDFLNRCPQGDCHRSTSGAQGLNRLRPHSKYPQSLPNSWQSYAELLLSSVRYHTELLGGRGGFGSMEVSIPDTRERLVVAGFCPSKTWQSRATAPSRHVTRSPATVSLVAPPPLSDRCRKHSLPRAASATMPRSTQSSHSKTRSRRHEVVVDCACG